MAQDSFKLGVVLLTILVGLTLSNGKPDELLNCQNRFLKSLSFFLENQHYFYSLEGQQVSPNVQLRLKRDTAKEETTQPPVTQEVTSEVNATKTTESSSTEKTQDSVIQPDKSRGFINESTVLENVDVNDSTFNASIESHLKDDNLTADHATDHFKYYNSTFVKFSESWIDLEEWNRTIHPGIVNQHSMLSKSYRYKMYTIDFTAILYKNSDFSGVRQRLL